MKSCNLPILLCATLLASCASDSGSRKSSSSPAERKTLSQRMEEKNGYKQDANGNWIPQNDKRSSFESKGEASNFAKKDYKKTEYKTGDYSKKSWWGNKDYDRKEYAGNTDGSRFQKPSDLQGKGAREAGDAAKIPDPYKTGEYATGDAREAGKEGLAKPSNDGIENRRKTYTPPEIIDWREQRALSLDQSKGLLGH